MLIVFFGWLTFTGTKLNQVEHAKPQHHMSSLLFLCSFLNFSRPQANCLSVTFTEIGRFGLISVK